MCYLRRIFTKNLMDRLSDLIDMFNSEIDPVSYIHMFCNNSSFYLARFNGTAIDYYINLK